MPSEFADSRRSSAAQQPTPYNDPLELHHEPDIANKQRTVSREVIDDGEDNLSDGTDEVAHILFQEKGTLQDYDDKECSSILSAISNEEISIASDILDHKSFCPRKNIDGEDINGHIYHIDSPDTDTYPNSETLPGESLMDDMSSMLGLTYDSGENTFTDDTTLFTGDFAEKKETRKSIKKEQERKRSYHLDEREMAQFGFENRAFMTALKMERDNKYEETVKYCSLAQFVEGNDIARRSFRRHKPATKLSKTEANVHRQSVVAEEIEVVKPEGSKVESMSFPQVSVVIEPPSPVMDEKRRTSRIDKSETEKHEPLILSPEYDLFSRLEKTGLHSNHSSNSNLLTIDTEQMQYLSCSPAATRRISSGSLLKASEAAALAASASSLYAAEKTSDKKKEESETPRETKKLPIINPLVRLPSWPRK